VANTNGIPELDAGRLQAAARLAPGSCPEDRGGLATPQQLLPERRRQRAF
jgi:hypothetical protein